IYGNVLRRHHCANSVLCSKCTGKWAVRELIGTSKDSIYSITSCGPTSERVAMAEPKPRRFRFSTDDLPPGERLQVWREGFVHRRMEMDFVDRSPDGLRFTIDFQQLGGIAAGIVRGTPSVFIRTPIDRNDGLYMIINRCGSF